MTEISIDSVSERFQNHLDIDENCRIIFSGKFGVGKTFFLNKFFDERKDKYNKFLVSPVNYVVSSNEDIFELIKADIIKDLFLTEKIDLKSLPEDTTLQKISSFVEDKSVLLGNFMLNTLAKLNPSLTTPKKVIDVLGEIYKNYKKKSNTKKPEDKTLTEEAAQHWFSTAEKIGHIYEHNYITKVINTFLNDLKEEEEKKNVLIIDDLDRVDPEHIFRILNVLSAHNNQFGAENKFAFDHVIIVCDIENLRKIFFHKYGAKVDFDGYIDKFYTADYFLYSNIDAVNTYIDYYSDSFTNKGEKSFIKLVFQALAHNNIMTVRKLIKHRLNFRVLEFTALEITQNQSLFPLYQIGFIERDTSLKLTSNDIRILNFFKLAACLFGSVRAFLGEIKSYANDLNFSFITDETFLEACRFLAFQDHLTCKQEIEIFARVKTMDDDSKYFGGFSKRVYEYSPPFFRFDKHTFNIILKWDSRKRYDGRENYFLDAIVTSDTFRNSAISDFKESHNSFWNVLNKIADSCNQNGYFKQAEIVY